MKDAQVRMIDRRDAIKQTVNSFVMVAFLLQPTRWQNSHARPIVM